MSCAYVNINPKDSKDNQGGGAKDNTEINKLFHNIIGNKPVVVLYFANWCQHCKNMKPEWENAIDDLNIKKFNSPKKVIHGDFNKYIIALEDGSYDKNKCPDVDKNVRGFPTINYYPDKKYASLESFEGERKKAEIKDWLSDKLDLGSVQSIPNHTGGNPQKGMDKCENYRREGRKIRRRRRTKRRTKRRKSRKTKRRKRRKSRKSKRRR